MFDLSNNDYTQITNTVGLILGQSDIESFLLSVNINLTSAVWSNIVPLIIGNNTIPQPT